MCGHVHVCIVYRVYLCVTRLDAALIRPGRVDMKAKIDHASEYQIEKIFQRFYPDEPEHRALEFAQLVCAVGKDISPAQVQGFFMFHKDDAQGAIDNVHNIYKV